jgi:hypothetical protein
MVTLKGGEVTFGRWKNIDLNKAMVKACQDSELNRVSDSELKNKLVIRFSTEWVMAFSIYRGSGFLKGKTVEETYSNIQNLDITESTMLGQAFEEFGKQISEEVKKKAN